MAFDIMVDRCSHIATVLTFGPAERAQGHAAMEALLAHPDVGPGTPVLFDLQDLKYIPTETEARALAESHISVSKKLGSRAAILVRPGAQYGMARMIQIIADLQGAKIAVFADRDEAISWLGSDSEK